MQPDQKTNLGCFYRVLYDSAKNKYDTVNKIDKKLKKPKKPVVLPYSSYK